MTMHDRKMLYFGDKTDVFIFTISTSIGLEKVTIAFETLERSKSKYFLEMLQRKNMIAAENALEYEILINEIEKEEDMEKIFKLKKCVEKYTDKVEINIEHLCFENVKALL
jgi:hypothetical protein